MSRDRAAFCRASLPGRMAFSPGRARFNAIRPKVYYRPQTALISLENTHNMAGGTVYPDEAGDEICDKAHDAGIHVHLDGARIFNAATYLRRRRRRDDEEVRFRFSSA